MGQEVCKTGGDRKAPLRGTFWALGKELSLALVGFALCRKPKSFEGMAALSLLGLCAQVRRY